MRNSDLAGITSTITQLERQFNEHFRYPYVLLNDVPFEQTFKEWVVPTTTQSRLSGLNWLKKFIAVLSNSQNQKLKLDSSRPNTEINHDGSMKQRRHWGGNACLKTVLPMAVSSWCLYYSLQSFSLSESFNCHWTLSLSCVFLDLDINFGLLIYNGTCVDSLRE